MRDIFLDKENVSNAKIASRDTLRFVCERCGVEVVRKGTHFSRRLLCRRCSTALTNIEKYGVENVAQSSEIKKKCADSIKKSVNVAKEKRLKTLKERYGVNNPGQIEEVKRKIAATVKNKYDSVSSFLHSEKAAEKRKKTNLKKYGAEFPLQSEAVQSRITDRHAFTSNDNPMHMKQSVEKRKETLNERYGGEVFSSPEIREKIKQTNLEKYGVKWSTQRKDFNSFVKNRRPHSWKYMYKGCMYDSSWEVALMIYAEDHSQQIERCADCFKYKFEGKTYSYFPDFMYEGQLVEIKGDQFFENGRMVNPFNSSQNEKYEAKHRCALEHNVKFMTYEDMKLILSYIEQKYGKSYLQSFRNVSDEKLIRI